MRLGRHNEAIRCFTRAHHLWRAVRDRRGMGVVLLALGDTHAAAGDPHGARTAWQQALDVYRAIDHPDTPAIAARLNNP
ncbi:MAG TPA: tetratricopeptide repeat protein [Micromonosporaceae bacterium]|nr:tetratricopeptide repeat protein [Micromonosporaceae bacterium]